MEKRNIWADIPDSLEHHTDARGDIVDVFYKETINHVAVVRSNKGAIRGHHYHKKTKQWMLVTYGALEYWWKESVEDNTWKMAVIEPGDIVFTPPGEVHVLKIITDNTFMAFTEGVRGGADYESDTFRIPLEIA